MKIVLSILCMLNLVFTYAQTICPDRPSQTSGPSSVPAGRFQLETGFQYAGNGSFNGGTVSCPTNLFRIGVGKGFEIRMVNGIDFHKSFGNLQTSFSPFQLGFKTQLLNNPDKKTQIGMYIHGITSTGANKWEDGYRGGIAMFMFTHQLNDKNSLSYNLGYQILAYGSLAHSIASSRGSFTLNYAHSMTDHLSIFAEAYGGVDDLAHFDDDNISLNMDFGLAYILKDNLQLDYYFGFGLLDRSNFHAVGVSFFLQKKTN